MQKILTVKGTKDLFGEDIFNHDEVIRNFSEICNFFSYQKISTPIIEHSSIFEKSLGLTSDIISKEMYSFVDKGGDSIVLRPEGTAAISRALISNSLQEKNLKKSKKSKIMVNAFFEPSTRTSLSFESAMYKLGGKVITFNRGDSSLIKGETFEDTIKTLNNYADIMVLRHPQKSFLEKASAVSTIPVINAGNGDGEHPTQALIDLYTIYRKFNKRVGFKRNYSRIST